MNAMPIGLFAEPSVIVFLLTPLLLAIAVAFVVAFVLLLVNHKTRAATLALLGVVGVVGVAVVLMAGVLFSIHLARSAAVSRLASQPLLPPTPAVTKDAAKPADAPAKTRPAWVNAKPRLVDDVYQMSIDIGPYTTRAECDTKLPEALQEAFGHYVEVCLGDPVTDATGLPPDELRQQLVKAQWEETRPYSVGPMVHLHVLLEFDRKFKDRVLEEHRQAVIAGRLQAVAAWTAIGLVLLTVLFGYLKIDLATGGAYRGRLRLAAAAAILGLVAVAVVAAQLG